jgi:hypothetical protein
MALFAFLVITSTALGATTIYVDASASGAGTGSNWTDAYTNLQDALASAASGDQIWVAAGVYYPDAGGGMTNDDRTATFTLITGVELYGGFAGGETLLSQRNWGTNVTVLSGDIDQNTLTNTNTYHVLTGGGTDSTAVLDGFTITTGRADGSLSAQKEGAGMVNATSSPTLSNLVFTGNFAETMGAGMFNKSSSSPTLTNVTFSSNESGSTGGGMRNSNSSPALLNVLFSGNKSQFGGGMYNDSSNPGLTNLTFSGNLALFGSGGGMYNSSSNPTLTNTILWNNQAGTSGHQIFNVSSTPVISYSDIQGSGGSSSWDTALGTDGGNNIDDDPLFVTPVDPATAPTTAGDLHLQFGSPALDSGDNGVCPSVDLDGNARPQGAACEMGPYEFIGTFSDVPPSHWAFGYIETIANSGLTVGYPDGTYRPTNQVTRAEMAVFLLKGIHGESYVPPTPDGSHPFSDISGHWAEAWIEQLYDEGMTAGYPDGTYRPGNQVTRAEIAVLLLVAKHGSGYTPPAANGSHPFSDIGSHWANAWIEQLYDEGLTAGYPDGTFRPNNPVTRAEMAVFLVATFGLTVP